VSLARDFAAQRPAANAVQDDFAGPLLDPALPCPAGLAAWNGSDPARRFAVYRNNVVSGLIDALADTFPVVQALVGEEFFRAMGSVFVRRAPPASRLLAFYGAGLPDFIDSFEPAQSVPYLADVARLEIARVRAYHAADAEPMTGAAVARAIARLGAGDAQRAERLRLALHPSLAALRSAYGTVSIWAAHQVPGEVDLAGVAVWEPEDALILRPQLDVLVLALPPGSARFVAGLQQGLAMDAAARAAAREHAGFEPAPALEALLAHGAVTDVQLDPIERH
jgi:hypothetical protein